MKNLFRIIILTLIFSMSLGACIASESTANFGAVINMIELEDIPTLDPSNATDPISLNSLANVMEGLVMQGPVVGEMVPGVAESWSFDEASLTWTFKLNPEATWVNSNGEKQRTITANDFVYSWDRVTSNDHFLYGYMITDVAKIIRYQAIDDSTLSVTLSKNVPYFLSLMAFATTYPIPAEAVEAAGDAFGTTHKSIWYNGPYYMSEWTHGSQFIWTKNNEYWDADNVLTPAVTWRIIEAYEPAIGIELYDAGEIDRVPLSGEFVTERKNDLDAVIVADTSVYYLMFNIANSGIENGAPLIDAAAGNDLFDNIKIRQAIAYQIEKTYITDVILNDGSTPAYSFVPAKYLSFNGDAFESKRGDGYMLTDKDLAATLFAEGMAEMGYTQGDNKLTFDILNYESASAGLIMEYIKQELDHLFVDYGITITLSALPLSQKLPLYQAGEFELTFSRWSPDYDWPTTYLDKWLTNNAHNLVGYSNNEYDSLVSSIGKTKDEAYENLRIAEGILLNDAVIIPIYQAANIILQNPSVHDIHDFLSGYDSSFKWAYKEVE